ncbi:MAG TPA: alpha/beta hydrolase [Bacteroidales bacterium]|nr:alpha/beta hydrolase [Bacteroidales bacterium]
MQLHYKVLGSGSVLVILHGLFGMSDNFVSIANALLATHKVYLPDLRNHGQSPHHSDVSYKAMSNDLAAFFKEHQIEKAHLLGHSMGGKVAMQFAYEYPKKVDRLIVADMSPAARNASQQHIEVLQAMTKIKAGDYSSRAQIEQEISKFVNSSKLKNLILKNLQRNPDGSFRWRINLDAMSNNLHEVFKAIDYHGWVCPNPALFLAGEFSDYIQEPDCELIRQMFSRVAFATVQGASHWLHADNPKAFAEEVAKFLSMEL